MTNDYIYDIELWPNLFLYTAIHAETGEIKTFEISPRKNEFTKLYAELQYYRMHQARMVGFNNIRYDYPVLHHMINHAYLADKPKSMIALSYKQSKEIINSDDFFTHSVWPNQMIVPQLDLMKIHHFDNKARATSLKMIEFIMRSSSIQESPVEFDQVITKHSQIREGIEYNIHDVLTTLDFYKKSKDQIAFRELMTERHDHDFMNYNDTKIGKQFLIMKLEQMVDDEICYIQRNGRRQVRQTPRDKVVVNDIIFPYITFKHPELQGILKQFREMEITNTIGGFKDFNCMVGDFKFVFGKGGIHGSVSKQVFYDTPTTSIVDLDVTSYYPSIGIANKVYPEHLGESFCKVYSQIKDQRTRYHKKSPESAMLKLALNGVYGDSNNIYSPFYDPQYTMTITINGQLMLCMLAEKLLELTGISMIQINTDGLTINMPRYLRNKVGAICRKWQRITGLALEQATYSRMWVRDVNNYIAEYKKTKKLKRKGAYEYKLDWVKNHSSLVVQKAVEAELVRGVSASKFICEHDDIYDFFLRTKVPKTSQLELDGKKMQRITRYLVSNKGAPFDKIMPPLVSCREALIFESMDDGYTLIKYPKVNPADGYRQKKSKTSELEKTIKSLLSERHIGINVGYVVTEHNTVKSNDVNDYDINFQFYIDEVEKLLKPFR